MGRALKCVKTGEMAFNRVFGMGRWEYLSAHPDAAATFNRMAASNTDGRATPIVEAYDFSAASTVIDLGGGRGVLMAAILTKHPDVKGMLTDLPPHGSPSPINLLDVQRTVMTGSQERSQEDLRAFLETAGFHLHRVIKTGTQDNIFEALPV